MEYIALMTLKFGGEQQVPSVRKSLLIMTQLQKFPAEVILLPPVLSVPKERMQPGVMVNVSGSMKNVLARFLMQCSVEVIQLPPVLSVHKEMVNPGVMVNVGG